jgi:DNA-binding transcriptional regulator GbsR (MarR family)
MKKRELLEEVKEEIKEEKVKEVKEKIKERVKEIEGCKKCLTEMEADLEEILEEEV